MSNILQFRLLERLREEESGIYSVQVSPNLRKYPTANNSLTVSFVCDPKNVEHLILAVHIEIAKLKVSGASQEDMEKVHQQGKQAMEQALRQNNFWISILTSRIQNNSNPADILGIPNIIKKISSDDIKNMTTKYLSGDNYMRFVLLPENE